MFRLNHVFLQLDKDVAANGRKKAKIALQKFDEVTCRVSKPHERWWMLCNSCAHCTRSLSMNFVNVKSKKNFAAHKGILSIWSSVFNRMFYHEMEKVINREIEDTEDQVLHEMFTGKGTQYCQYDRHPRAHTRLVLYCWQVRSMPTKGDVCRGNV